MQQETVDRISGATRDRLEDVIASLEHLVRGLRSGSLAFASEGKQMRVHPSSVARLRLKARQKNGEERVDLRLSWPRMDERELSIRPRSPASREAERTARLAEREPAHGGEQEPAYEEWTREALYQEAARREIAGRSGMKKRELLRAIRGSDGSH